MGSYTELSFSPGWAFHERGTDFVRNGPLTEVMDLLLGVITQDILVTKEPVMMRSLKNELT